MKFPKFLTKDQVAQLELETLSTELRVYLTRLLKDFISENYSDHYLIKVNELVNRARNMRGSTIFRLEDDGEGGYSDYAHAWNNAEFELLLRRLSTTELVEFLFELIQEGYLDADTINSALETDGSSFRFYNEIGKVNIEISSIIEIEESPHPQQHQNIRFLVHRMEVNLKDNDFPGVLHSSASIFETLAKEVVGKGTIQNQTLAGFFGAYRADSKLPAPILDYILNIYQTRNTTPLAGHGSTQTPTITNEEAVVLCEMTKAFVKIEYKLRFQEEDTNPKTP